MDDLKIEHLTALIDAYAGGACMNCGTVLCGHSVVLSTMLGHKDMIFCSRCLAHTFARDHDEFLEHAAGHVAHRDCLSEAFDYASAREGIEPGPRPRCLFGSTTRAVETAPMPEASAAPVGAAVVPSHDAFFDAGDMGCGDLVLELRLRLREMAPRTVLLVRARDPGAPEDLPAWCGMTGHSLLLIRRPDYWIRKKEN